MLRPATPHDAAALAAISMEVWLGTYIRRGVSAFFADYALQTFTADRFRATLADPEEHILVSQNQDGPDGFLRLTQNRPCPVTTCPATAELTTLYIQPRHQGRGLGTALLDAGLARARSLGVESLWLAANAENSDAIRFYIREGFDAVGETRFRIQDEEYPNTVLARRVPV